MSDSNSPITSEIPAAERDLWLRKAQTLSDALPYMCQFGGKRVVVKYGGHAMGEEALALQFAQDIVLLNQVGIEPVVVHGGGPQIKKMLERLKIQSEFIDGLRVTDKATVDIVEMVLAGSINAEIVTAINRSGGFAIGLSGKDGNLIKCRKLARTKKDPDSSIETVLDLGFVGEPVEVNTHILKHFEQSDIIPVVAPIGYGEQGETFNINADTAAGYNCRGSAGGTPADADRRARRAGQKQKADPRPDHHRRPSPDGRRNHFRRDDPQDRNLHRRRRKRG